VSGLAEGTRIWDRRL